MEAKVMPGRRRADNEDGGVEGGTTGFNKGDFLFILMLLYPVPPCQVFHTL